MPVETIVIDRFTWLRFVGKDRMNEWFMPCQPPVVHARMEGVTVILGLLPRAGRVDRESKASHRILVNFYSSKQSKKRQRVMGA